MKSVFVQTDNVKRFLAGVAEVEERGAAEASFLLVEGGAGHGKSKTAAWWALHNDAVEIRIKAAATPHWVLKDIVTELGEPAPAHSCEKLFAQAVGSLARDPRPIVVDEVEKGLADLKVLETVRDLSDLTEVPVVMVGREWVKARLKRERQIWSRISAIASFVPAGEADVARLCAELAEVEIGEDVVAEIHRRSEGLIREVVNAIKVAERCGRRSGGPVTMKTVNGTALTKDFQRQRAAAAKAAE